MECGGGVGDDAEASGVSGLLTHATQLKELNTTHFRPLVVHTQTDTGGVLQASMRGLSRAHRPRRWRKSLTKNASERRLRGHGRALYQHRLQVTRLATRPTNLGNWLR